MDAWGSNKGVLEVEGREDRAFWSGRVDDLQKPFLVDQIEESFSSNGRSAVRPGSPELPNLFAVFERRAFQDTGIVEGVYAVLKDDGTCGGVDHLAVLPKDFGFRDSLLELDCGCSFRGDDDGGVLRWGEGGDCGTSLIKVRFFNSGEWIDKADATGGHEGD